MTPKELRSLDERVAIYWNNWRRGDPTRGEPEWMEPDFENERDCLIPYKPVEGPLPHYSTDIAVAWQMLEEILSYWGGEFHAIDPTKPGQIGMNWECRLDADSDDPPSLGETAPIAICRAVIVMWKNIDRSDYPGWQDPDALHIVGAK